MYVRAQNMTKHDVKLIMVSGTGGETSDVTGCNQTHCKLSCQVSFSAAAQTASLRAAINAK